MTEYGVKRAGLIHNGVATHVGRLVWMESTDAAAVAALASGKIGAKASETLHDWAPGNGSGMQNSESLTTYIVQAAGSGRVVHNLIAKTTGQTLQLDNLDDTAKTLVGLGFIA
jgi:hypothetical protein